MHVCVRVYVCVHYTYTYMYVVFACTTCIGLPPSFPSHLMGSSGLQEMLESIYAPNAVVHMLSGKAIARAVRGHFIVDAALNALMLHSGFNVPLPCQPMSYSSDNEADVEAPTKNQDVDKALTLYEKLMAGEISAEEVCSSNVLERIKDSLKITPRGKFLMHSITCTYILGKENTGLGSTERSKARTKATKGTKATKVTKAKTF